MRKAIEIQKNVRILFDLVSLEYVGNIEIHVVEQEKWLRPGKCTSFHL